MYSQGEKRHEPAKSKERGAENEGKGEIEEASAK